MTLGAAPARAAAFFDEACPARGQRDPEGCHLLAVLLFDGRGVAPDPLEAVELFEQNCSAGYARSCSSLAVERRAGKHVAKDESMALSLDMRACDLGDVGGCLDAAQAFDLGRGTAPDESQTRKYLMKVCEQKSVVPKESLATTKTIIACGMLKELDERARPFERAVMRAIHVGHRETPIDKQDRTAVEAKNHAEAAAAQLNAGKPFELVAEKFGNKDSLTSASKESIHFRMKPGVKAVPAFTIAPGHATVAANPSFGFIVWYRVR